MAWRLGLDLGTNSIGWCALNLKNNAPDQILDMGVRIFHDGREPSGEGRIGDSLAVQRRTARGMRRRRDRHNRQKRKVYSFFIEAELITKDDNERIKLIDPYLVRKEGLDRKLESKELVRAFYHLAVRRGFKSNRKDQNSTDTELSTNLQKIKNFQTVLNGKEVRTIGEYLYNLKVTGKPLRFRPENSEFYPERSMYEDEFFILKKIQQKYYPNLNWNLLYDLIFFQRPLAKQEKGKCTFYIDKERAYKSHPISHKFRILQDINNLMMIDGYGQKIGLSNDEKTLLYQKLDNCKTMGFNKIRTLLGTDSLFNLESRASSSLNGNSIAYTMRNKEYFGTKWDHLSTQEQDTLIEKIIESETNEEIKEFLTQWDLTEEQTENILNCTFASGTTNLSKEFMYDCSDKMRNQWIPYHEAVESMGLHHSDFNNREELLKELPYYGEILKGSTIGAKPHLAEETNSPELIFGKIGNPTVHIALNQLRLLVNALITRLGSPSEIVIELSRDLKNSKDAKADIFKKQKHAKKENDRIKKEFTDEGITHPSSWDIKKFKLWEELSHDSLSHRCIYCGNNISRSQLASDKIEIEHILPFSRTLMNSMENLTVAHKKCNQIKANRTPDEAFSSNPSGYDYQAILERASYLPGHKYKKFLKDAIQEFEKDSNFLDRQLTDNAYLSRKSKEYLSSICHFNKIWTIKGGQTAILRSKWGLNKILSSSRSNWFKNRSDHRHHAIDALVIGLTDRSLIQSLAKLNMKGIPEELGVPPFKFSLHEVQENIKDILVSIKPDHGKEGKLFQETALGQRFKIQRRSFSDFSDKREIEWIESKKIRFRLKELMREKGFTTAKNIMISEWVTTNDSIGPYCKIPTWVTRKNLPSMTKNELNRIFDNDLKLKIYSTIDVDSLSPKELQVKLESFSEESKIRHIRIAADNTQNAIEIKSVKNKAYLPNDFLYVVVWGIPPHKNKKKWEYKGYFVNRVQANDKKFIVPKPHPSAKKMATLYKNDVLFLAGQNGGSHYARIAGYSTTQNKLDIQSIYSSNNLQEWLESTSSNLTDDFFKPQTGQYFQSINALWQKYSIKNISITVDGRGRKLKNYDTSNRRDRRGGEIPIF